MKQVLVTGATGFIGSALCKELLRSGMDGEQIELIVWCRTAEKLAAEVRSNARIICDDLSNAAAHSALIENVSYVFHVAANAAVSSAESGYQNNVNSTTALLLALKDCPALERVVYTSSIGAIDRIPADSCAEPLTETSPANPVTRYGESKLKGEVLIQESGLPYTIVRPTWIYGHGMRSDSHIAAFVAGIEKGSVALRVNYPGVVSLMHVDDLVRAMIHLAACAVARDEIYFCSDNQPRTIGQVLRIIAEFTGKRAGDIPLPPGSATLFRKTRRFLPFAVQCMGTPMLVASAEKLLATGFTPAISFDDGLTRMLRQRPYGGPVRKALVTGAAGGIGASTCKQLYAQGYDVIALDKNLLPADFLEQMPEIEYVQLDLADQVALDQWLEKRSALLSSLSVCVNCAGIGQRGSFVTTDWSDQRRIVAVNIMALSSITHAVLKNHQTGTALSIVNVSSSTAFQPVPYMAVYAASKAYVSSFTEALYAEHVDAGVRVIAICPPGTRTNFQASAKVKVIEGEKLLSPAEVASSITRAISTGECNVTIGIRAKVMDVAARMMPRRRRAMLWRSLMAKMR